MLADELLLIFPSYGFDFEISQRYLKNIWQWSSPAPEQIDRALRTLERNMKEERRSEEKITGTMNAEKVLNDNKYLSWKDEMS